jgi:hypothetical protein
MLTSARNLLLGKRFSRGGIVIELPPGLKVFACRRPT